MPQAPIPPGPIPFYRLRAGGGRLQAHAPHANVPGQAPQSLTGYSEFYCQSTGNNLNSGSDTSDSAKYTSTNGNWNGTTTFIPTDGSNPYGQFQVGDYASVCLDAATVSVYIGRVTAVQNATNGVITLSSTAKAGVPPTSSVTGRTIRVGGAWRGPNAAVGWPMNADLTAAVNIAGNPVRVNYKNDATYSITSQVSGTNSGEIHQGYKSSPGDGIGATGSDASFKATLDGGSNAITLLSASNSKIFIDWIFSNNGGTSPGSSVSLALFIRCIFRDFRGACNIGADSRYLECEFYNWNQSGSSNIGALTISSNSTIIYNCYFHDATGSSSHGIVNTGANQVAGVQILNCLFDTIGGNAIQFAATAGGCGITVVNNTFHNITGSAIRDTSNAATPTSVFGYNNLFTKCGAIITDANNNNHVGHLYGNGYGQGSFGIRNPSHFSGIQEISRILLTPSTSPYNAETTGDFSLVLSDAIGTGRVFFTQTANSKTGTNSYPDLGAVVHRDAALGPRWGTIEETLPYAYINYVYTENWKFNAVTSLSVVAGTLPSGISLSSVSSTEWELTGTPTNANTPGATFTFTIRATVAGVNSADQIFHITVQDDPDGGSAFAGGF